jgi:predicted transcriptional regulator
MTWADRVERNRISFVLNKGIFNLKEIKSITNISIPNIRKRLKELKEGV